MYLDNLNLDCKYGVLKKLKLFDISIGPSYWFHSSQVEYTIILREWSFNLSIISKVR